MTKHHASTFQAPTFHALADPTRAAMVARLARGPASVSELARPFGMALPTILAHLNVLQSAGLAVSAKQGRSRIVTLNPEPLHQSADWLRAQATLWEARLDRLDALALSLAPEPALKGRCHDPDPD